MGGIALGKGVTSSGLMDVLRDIIRDIMDGLGLGTVVMVLSAVVLVRGSTNYTFSDVGADDFGIIYPPGRLSLHSSATPLQAFSSCRSPKKLDATCTHWEALDKTTAAF